MASVGRNGCDAKSRRKKTSGEALRSTRSCGGGPGSDCATQTKISFADTFEIHRGLVVRRDCERAGVFEGHRSFASQPRSQSIGEASVTLEQSRSMGRVG